MAFNKNILAKQVRAMHRMNPVTVTFGSTNVNGIKTVLNADRQVSLVGEFKDYELAVQFIISDLTNKGVTLDDKDEATIAGTVYQIMGHANDPLDVTVTVAFGSRYG